MVFIYSSPSLVPYNTLSPYTRILWLPFLAQIGFEDFSMNVPVPRRDQIVFLAEGLGVGLSLN